MNSRVPQMGELEIAEGHRPKLGELDGFTKGLVEINEVCDLTNVDGVIEIPVDITKEVMGGRDTSEARMIDTLERGTRTTRHGS